MANPVKWRAKVIVTSPGETAERTLQEVDVEATTIRNAISEAEKHEAIVGLNPTCVWIGRLLPPWSHVYD